MARALRGLATGLVLLSWGCSAGGESAAGGVTGARLADAASSTTATTSTTSTTETATTAPEDGARWVLTPIAGLPSGRWNDPDDGRADAQIELADVGYVEQEFLLADTAVQYERVGVPEIDGRWAAREAGEHDFATRLLVRRPAAADDFNGTVVVEWLNVSSGKDLDAGFRSGHLALTRLGFAWVGVSAQEIGVNELASNRPRRYGDLDHPGDRFSYDIFTKAGRAVATAASPVLGHLEPDLVLAAGASQSAGRLLTYANAVQPRTGVYDGFLLVSGSAPAPLDDATMPPHALVRTDLATPVLSVQSEGDVVVFGAHRHRQPDSDAFRLWEIAGTAQLGQYGNSLRWPPDALMTAGDPCVEAANAAPFFVISGAVVVALERWVRDGQAPPSADRLELADPDAPDPIARDEYGNALGGVRLPHVEAPLARHDGVANAAAPGAGPESAVCGMWGRTIPFTPDRLADLYPTRDAYVDAVDAAARRAVAAGFMLQPEADLLVEAARADAGRLAEPGAEG